ncbi:hypothetical protein AN619_08130 [Thermotalea metallivorans]|uniref:Uncharacterized protein n=1 Tax=Thermotalea metallivorans TaxID=520762 RepID=A0A140L8E6_9FIRM|nr:hypothetical protein AN619_08130 [Thermotalea metallivorans]
MYRVIMKKQIYFIGKISDLLEMLEDLSNQYTTLQSMIDDHLACR